MAAVMSEKKFDKSREVVLVMPDGERIKFWTVKAMSEYVHSIAGEGGLKEPASYYVRWRKLDKPVVVELTDMLATPPPKNGKKRNEDVELRSEEHTSELQSHHDLVCRLLLEKKK